MRERVHQSFEDGVLDANSTFYLQRDKVGSFVRGELCSEGQLVAEGKAKAEVCQRISLLQEDV